ncbi:MAG: hypothetical protein R3C61_14885 [Bacteroidia bacterium]
METNGFEIKLNDKLLCRAGFTSARYHLTCMLHVIKHPNRPSGQTEIIVGGTEGNTLKLINWVEKPLHEGDKITVRIISGDFDTPQSYFDTKRDLNDSTWLNSRLNDFLGSGG